MLKVMCVDDSDSILALLTAALPKFLSAEVTTANSGSAAIEQMSGGVIPNVVLIDYMMPERSGIEVAAALTRNPAFTKTCFIIHSTVGSGLKKSALNSGVYQVIDKPTKPKELAAAIADTYMRFIGGEPSPLIAATAPPPAKNGLKPAPKSAGA